MRLTIVGAGYVGLVSGACFADLGHDVVCVDNDAARVAALERGEIPIYEPGLDALVASGRAAGRLSFTTDIRSAVGGSEVVFIAVGTPPRASDGCADLRAFYGVATEIAQAITGFTVVVDKSTVPVGAGDEVERIIRETRPDAAFAVVSNPEFLREGAAIGDFQRPDRIVVGLKDARAQKVMEEVYRPITDAGAPLLITRRRSAEIIKYASNAFLAMKVTFMNEIADLCEAADAEVEEVETGVGLDRRIGPNFLRAGPGYGGSCFPKDTLALARTAQDLGVGMRLVETTIAINEERRRAMARKVASACGGSVRDLRIAVLGLTFKPETDDVRESPALTIIQALQDAGATVCAYDPKGMPGARTRLTDVAFAANAYEAVSGADALVVATDWEEFRALDLKRVRNAMRGAVLVDLRNLLDGESASSIGFHYSSLGRATPKPAVLRAAAE